LHTSIKGCKGKDLGGEKNKEGKRQGGKKAKSGIKLNPDNWGLNLFASFPPCLFASLPHH
jgi:hypothetical protein